MSCLFGTIRRGRFRHVLGWIFFLFISSLLIHGDEVRIRISTPLQAAQDRMGSQTYPLLEDEGYFFQKVSERALRLGKKQAFVRPPNASDAEWRELREELEREEKAQLSTEHYELSKQAGEYVGWFGIVRSRRHDKNKDQTLMLAEHKYFDGQTDLRMQVVSLFGAGDFRFVLPGKIGEEKIPSLSLVCIYGKVGLDQEKHPLIKAEYARVWHWGLFTFADYGKDKSNPEWVKLRQIPAKDAYEANPKPDYYEKILGPRPAPEG